MARCTHPPAYMSSILFSLILIIFPSVFSFTTSPYGFFNSRHCPNNLKIQFDYRTTSIQSSTRRDMTMVHTFNPFTSRNKNSKVKWFEADLEVFYDFVESQPLLTAEQELQFGKALRMSIHVEKIRSSLALRSLPSSSSSSSGVISDEVLANYMNTTTPMLQKMFRYADVAQERLLNSNLKLVLAVVSRYRTSEIPNAELIAEGTRGLSRAVVRYDYSKGFRFATYATWYVHQAVAEYVRLRKHPAKMPSRYLLLSRKVKQFSSDFQTEMGRLPTVKEISSSLNQPQFDILKVLSMQQYPLLLNAPVQSKDNLKNEGREKTFEEMLPSLYKVPSKNTESKDLRRDMERMMLKNLNDVERDVLRLRLGLDDGRVKPVKEVGKRFKISWKQVRTVEKEALSKLLLSKEISGFVDNYNSVGV